MRAKGQRKQLKCFGCGKIGHKKSQCFAQKKKNSNKGNKSSDDKGQTLCAIVNEQDYSCVEEQTAFCAHAEQGSDSDEKIEFLMDSGATQNMANDERYFDNLESINDVKISVANFSKAAWKHFYQNALQG